MGNNLSKSNEGSFRLKNSAEKLLLESGCINSTEEIDNGTALFEKIERFVLRQAPVLTGQGQFAKLKNLINLLPGKYQSSWMLYWSASASLPVDPDIAGRLYEKALEGFIKTQDNQGIFLSWCGKVDSFIVSRGDITELNHWINWMGNFVQENQDFPSSEVEARVVQAMFCGLMYSMPNHPELPVWVQRLGQVMQKLPDRNRCDAISTHYRSFQSALMVNTPCIKVLDAMARSKTLIKQANFEKARYWLALAQELVDQSNSSFLSFNLNLSQAELYFARGDDKAGVSALTRAALTGRENNYMHTACHCRGDMYELCMKALENNIEVSYVQKLIHKYNLYPESPPIHINNWPWRIRIFTLGRFSVVIDDKPFSSMGREKNKQMDLLKVLLAMGGRDVCESKICEILWPDAEGDNAHSSFTSTLSRLRRQLGSDVLVVHNGQLSLNDHLCWLDTWAFERFLGELDTALSCLGSNTQRLTNLEHEIHRLFDLYRGLFLEKEKQYGWMLPRREYLQTKLLRIIKRLINFYSSRGHCKEVITLYEKAHELDPLSEEYYRGLMRCHTALGNESEALEIYNNCQTILNASFGIRPSKQTRALYDRIKTGDKRLLKRACEQCAQVA